MWPEKIDGPVIVECIVCGTPKKYKAYDARWKKKKGMRPCCSRECVYKLNTGKANGDVHNKGVKWQGIKKNIVRQRGNKCEICGWDRSSVDLCHIIDRSDGGSDKEDNLVLLCPNHHRLFDHGLLNKDEKRRVS